MVFHGYVESDRWGRHVLYNGPIHFFLSDTVAKQLAPFRGLPLAISVTKLSQPMNPGGAMLTEISEVTARGFAGAVQLSASVKQARVPRGEGITVRYQLQNTAAEPITVAPELLSFILVTRTPFDNQAIGYQDPENRSYWYFNESYLFLDGKNAPLVIACREIRGIVTAGEMVARGQGITAAPNTFVTLASGSSFSGESVIGKELPAGEYEVFVSLPQLARYPAPVPASKRLNVDVVETR